MARGLIPRRTSDLGRGLLNGGRLILGGGGGGGGPSIPTPAIISGITWELYVDASLEFEPPTAQSAQAQNVGVADGATLTMMTDFSVNERHLTVDAAKPFTWQEDSGRGAPAFRAPAATGGKGGALAVPITLNATGITTFAVAVKDNENSSAGGYIFALYRSNSVSAMSVFRTTPDQWSMRNDSGASDVSSPDRWLPTLAARRTRLHVYEIDRTADPVVIRRWDNGIPMPDTTCPRLSGTVTLTRLFSLPTFSGNNGIFNADILFAGVYGGALTAGQRDTISQHYTAVANEVAYQSTFDWDWYAQVDSPVRVLHNADWESDASGAPEAWRSRAQNVGILDLTAVPTITNFATGNHFDAPTPGQSPLMRIGAVNGHNAFNYDGVDDLSQSRSPVTLPPNVDCINVAAPPSNLCVIMEHGPNAFAGTNGLAMLGIEIGRSEFAGQTRRPLTPSTSYTRHRANFGDTLPHVLVWEGDLVAANYAFRTDKVPSTTSTSNVGTPAGNYTDTLRYGARVGAAFPMAGNLAFSAIIEDNRIATRVLEHHVNELYLT